MWIPITLAAATFQVLRTSRQHQLRSVLSVNGAGFVRYAYGFPLALIVAVVTFGIVGARIPEIPGILRQRAAANRLSIRMRRSRGARASRARPMATKPMSASMKDRA